MQLVALIASIALFAWDLFLAQPVGVLCGCVGLFWSVWNCLTEK